MRWLAQACLCGLTALGGCLERTPGYGEALTGSGAGDGSVSGDSAGSAADDGAGSGTGGSAPTSATTPSGSTTSEVSTGTTTPVGTTTAGTTTGLTTTGLTTTSGFPANCAPLWAKSGWSLTEPENLTTINSAGFDGDPHLSPDSLTLYFASNRAGGQGGADVYTATRANRGAPFLNVTNIGSANSTANDYTFAVADGNVLAFLNSARSGGAGNTDLWLATRATPADMWAIAGPVTELNSADEEYDVHTRDGLTLYYNVSAGGQQNNYVTTRASLGDMFPAGTALATNSSSSDDSPTVSEDGLLLVFASTRPGGMGGHDVYYATRPAVGDAWSQPQLLVSINTPDREGETHLRFDACELFFTSDKPGGSGAWDLYRTSFVPP